MKQVTRENHLWTVYILIMICLTLSTFLILLQYDKMHSTYTALPSPSTTFGTTSAPRFLHGQEVVVIVGSSSDFEIILPVEQELFQYVKTKNSCGVHFEGSCVVARTGPGTDFEVVAKLRNNVILKVDGKVTHNGLTWYKIIFDELVQYPERIPGTMYVSDEYVDVLLDEGEKNIWEDGDATTTKHIIVNRNEQKLYAYDGDALFMETLISTGLELSPTQAGTFTIFKKTPSRYMQGPLPGFTDIYDLPGVPWNLYFTTDGAVIHGTYWHDSFGSPYSHGCVNLSPEAAHKLYNWAPLGTRVTVR